MVKGKTLTINKDKTVAQLALMFGISEDVFRKINPTISGNLVRANTTFVVPKNDATSTEAINSRNEQSYLKTVAENNRLKQQYLSKYGLQLKEEAFWQGKDYSDDELYNHAGEIIDAKKQEEHDRKVANYKRALATKNHNEEFEKNGPDMSVSRQAVYANARDEWLTKNGTSGIFGRSLTLNGNTLLGLKAGMLNLQDQLKLGEDIKDLTTTAAKGIVGAAGAVSTLPANVLKTVVSKYAPGIIMSSAANKGLDEIADGDEDSWANNRYVRAGANALAFGTGSGLVKGAGSYLLTGAGLKTAATEAGLEIAKSPFAGMLGSAGAEHVYDTVRSKDENGEYTFDKNNYGKMIIGGIGFGLGSAASNALKRSVSKMATLKSDEIGTKLSNAISEGNTKSALELETQLDYNNKLLNNKLFTTLTDVPSATGNATTGTAIEIGLGTIAGAALAGVSKIDNDYLDSTLQKYHLIDVMLPIMNEKLGLYGKDAAFWLKRKNHGNSTVGEMVTNIGNAIVGKSNPDNDFTGSYVLSKKSVIGEAARLGMFNDPEILKAVETICSIQKTKKELRTEEQKQQLKLALQYIAELNPELLNNLSSELLEIAIQNASSSNNNFNNAKGHEGYVNTEYLDEVHNGVREGQRVLLNSDATPEQIASALAGAYAGSRNGTGYLYGNILGNFKGNKELFNLEFMDTAAGFNMQGEKVPLFLKTPGGKYIVNKGAVTAGGRERQPVVGEDSENFVLSNISGYNMIPLQFGGKTYEFYMDTPGYGKTSGTYQSSSLKLGAAFGLGLDYYSRMHYSTGLREIPESQHMFTNTLMNGRASKVKPFEWDFTIKTQSSGMLSDAPSRDSHTITFGIPIITKLLKAHNANIDYKNSLEGSLENNSIQSNVRLNTLYKNEAMNTAFGTNFTIGNIGGNFTSKLNKAIKDPNIEMTSELRSQYYDTAMRLSDKGIGLKIFKKNGSLSEYGLNLSKLRMLSDAENSLRDGYKQGGKLGIKQIGL